MGAKALSSSYAFEVRGGNQAGESGSRRAPFHLIFRLLLLDFDRQRNRFGSAQAERCNSALQTTISKSVD